MVTETTAGAPRRIPDADRPQWRAFFRGQYPIVRTQTRFGLAWQGSVNLADLEALPVVAPLLHTVPLSEGAQVQVVCDAYRMTRGAPDAWTQFQADTQPWATLSARAAATLENPTVCVQGRAPRGAFDLALDDDERAHKAGR